MLLLRVRDLRVNLAGRKIFGPLSFELGEGDTLVVLGPNGSGKTVLLRTLLRLTPFEGDVIWKKGIRLGYVPQRLTPPQDLPVSVSDFFHLRKQSSKSSEYALREVGLDPAVILKNRLGLLSSGQFQRVLLAWALAGVPQFLLLDEPFTGVDAEGEKMIQSLLNRVRTEKRLGVILVTHHWSSFREPSARVLRLGG